MKWIKALLILAVSASLIGCSGGNVTTEGVKEKEKQIDEASKKLNPSSERDDRANEQEH